VVEELIGSQKRLEGVRRRVYDAVPDPVFGQHHAEISSYLSSCNDKIRVQSLVPSRFALVAEDLFDLINFTQGKQITNEEEGSMCR
jgi:hypothetical protein